MAQLDSLRLEVRPDLFSCPDPSIDRALVDSAIELCRQSHWWRADGDPIPVADGVSSYDLDSPEPSSRVERIDCVRYGNTFLSPATWPQLAQQIARDQGVNSGAPRHFALAPGGGQSPPVMAVHPIPGSDEESDAGTLYPHVVLVPTRGSTLLPDALVEEFFDALIAGAKYRLQLVPAKPWTNPELAGVNRTIFARGVARAKREALSSGWQPLRVQQRRFV